MAQTAVPGGTIIRSDDGTWYYIRDDKLDQFKVTDQETLSAFSELEEKAEQGDEVAGFSFLPSGPGTFESISFNNIGFGNLALRAEHGLGIGTC
ncbi:MAG TPA: hypothetical protein VK277_15610 [Acidimicrobiales bacterium]|nr:hypothetical protein [Acidimicrobiales bacterium]